MIEATDSCFIVCCFGVFVFIEQKTQQLRYWHVVDVFAIGVRKTSERSERRATLESAGQMRGRRVESGWRLGCFGGDGWLMEKDRLFENLVLVSFVFIY